ncbi:MAG TPA: serine/threonine-protein kinase [Pirellulales bacterium]|jgi:serine/threonine-protein kinase|nr:serine/threonine-protein kinase [Pirellulales bacterium]
MPEWTAEQIGQAAFDRDLIDEHELRTVLAESGSLECDPEQIKQSLVRRELVTNYQLEKLLRGDRSGFFYGKYKVLYQIGSGTFARVFRAVHRETGEVRAVKVLRARHFAIPEMREQFLREGEMGCTLRHPNIVPIYEAAATAGACYIVMEFIEGRNLREHLRVRSHLKPEEAIRLTVDICRGLDYAFQRGISHKDLKSSNVLISSLGQAKLLDFGLAGADPNSSDTELAKLENPRTIDYAALERCTNVRKDDMRSDIFFLGCILYNMLSGKPALEETQDRLARLSRNRFEAMAPIAKLMPELPGEIVAIVNKSAQFYPDQRYQTPAEMLQDLLRVSHRRAAGANGKAHDASGGSGKQRTLMIVEPNFQAQESLRNHFKQKGFRVLVTADPLRPSSLFTDNHQPADCVIFSTSNLGEEALEAFNHFGEKETTKTVPAILLLGPRHQDMAAQAQTADHRATVTTPIKMKHLLRLFDEMMPAAKEAQT